MTDLFAGLTDEEQAELERDLRRDGRIGTTAFQRFETRIRRLKVKGDCGHWIDGTESYRYGVWKHYGDPGISQRIECESCARVDLRG